MIVCACDSDRNNTKSDISSVHSTGHVMPDAVSEYSCVCRSHCASLAIGYQMESLRSSLREADGNTQNAKSEGEVSRHCDVGKICSTYLL